jgi:hypothetical protein
VTADREDLLFLYAADALEGDERAEVEAWLAREGAPARAALAEAELEVAGLTRALAPVAPDPAVRERLRRRIEAPRARRASSGWARAALAAGLAALAAGGLGYGLGRSLAERDAGARVAALAAELAEAHAQRDALDAQLAEAIAERDALDEELAEQEAAYRQLESEQVLARKTIETLSADHTEALSMVGTAARPDARARVYWDWDSWYCYLRAEGLSPGPNGVYALWLFTEDGDVIGVGTFGTDARGEATLIAPVPHDVGHVVRAGVSIEPDDRLGSRPRGEVVLQGPAG